MFIHFVDRVMNAVVKWRFVEGETFEEMDTHRYVPCDALF